MSVALRPAVPRDAHAVAGIVTDWVATTDWMPKLHSADENLHFFSGLIAAGGVTVAEARGALAGFIERQGAEIGQLFVARPHRGAGCGATLIAAAQRAIPRLELWCFLANSRARAFYARHGFTEVARTDGTGNAEQLPDVRLVWERQP